MIPFVIFFLLGTCCLCLCSEIPPLTPIFLGCCFISFLYLIPKLRQYKLTWCLVFLLGFFWAGFHAHLHLQHRLPKEIENKPIAVVGEIISIPQGLDHKSFEFKLETSQISKLWKNPGIVRLSIRNPPFTLQVGDRISCHIKLRRPHGYANPGSFDKEKYFFANRISAEGQVLTKYDIKKMAAENKSHQANRYNLLNFVPNIFHTVSIKVHQLRNEIALNIQNQSKEMQSHAGIITALVVGTREGITPHQWQVFRQTGTAHLIAISGLHVGLVASLFFYLVRIFYGWFPNACLKLPSQIVAAYAAIFAAISYAVLAGLTLPTQRAVIMVIIFMLAIILRRQKDVWRSYFLALGLVLIFDPLSCLSGGFWLSFSAVAVLLYGMQNRIAPKGIGWKWFRSQGLVFLGLAPVSLALFQQFSWLSPITNIFAIPWVSLTVVPFALLGSLFSFISCKLGGCLLSIANISLQLLWPCLEKSSAYAEKIAWHCVPASPLVFAMSLLGIILMLAPKGFPARKISWIFLLPLIVNTPQALQAKALRFTLLDVGQGLAAVIETKNHTLLYDTGPKMNDNLDMGSQVVLPFLKTRGKSHIDTIIVSHADNDHIGGLGAILKEIPSKKILSSEPEKVRPNITDESLNYCNAGEKWNWDGVEFEILSPGSDLDSRSAKKKRNNFSCVLKIQSDKQAILLTGDIEAFAEHQLLKQIPRKLASTILVVPHHGSKSSSTQAFIQAVNPQFALIPAGYYNGHGHPHSEVLKRYKDQGVTVLTTAEQGAISFDLNSVISNINAELQPNGYRKTHAKFWQDPIK